jgi:hypothetical protein
LPFAMATASVVAALKFLRIVDSGRQRDGRTLLAEINRAINLAIRPKEDLAGKRISQSSHVKRLRDRATIPGSRMSRIPLRDVVKAVTWPWTRLGS